MSITPEGPAAPDDVAPLYSSMTVADAEDAAPPARRRARIRPAVGAPACALVGGIVGFGVAKVEMPAEPVSAPVPSPSPTASTQPIRDALSKCGVASSYFTVADGGRSLTVEAAGKSYGASLTATYCVLRRLHASESVISRMGQTRALDGRQTAAWAGYSASWSYHPDHGMNVVVESADVQS